MGRDKFPSTGPSNGAQARSEKMQKQPSRQGSVTETYDFSCKVCIIRILLHTDWIIQDVLNLKAFMLV